MRGYGSNDLITSSAPMYSDSYTLDIRLPTCLPNIVRCVVLSKLGGSSNDP